MPKRAVSVTPGDSMAVASRLSNFWIQHRCQPEKLGQLEVIREAITVSRQAVELKPEDSMQKGWAVSQMKSLIEGEELENESTASY